MFISFTLNKKLFNNVIALPHRLKEKSRVVMIIDYSRDYTVVNGVQYFFQTLALSICKATYFNLLRSAK